MTGSEASTEIERLLFHFRASDPGIYQDAAIALGHLLPQSQELRSRLEQYAARHGLTLAGPVPLDGVRGPRRLLLLRASARAHWERTLAHPTSEVIGAWEPEDPLPVDGATDLPGNPRDLSVRLLAERILLEADEVSGRFDRCLRMVREAGEGGAQRWDRASARRWMELLGTLLSRAPESNLDGLAGLWRDRVAEWVRAHPAGVDAPVHRRVQSLALLDEAARLAAGIPEGELRLCPEEWRPGGTEATVFLRERIAAWRSRRETGEEGPGSEAVDPTGVRDETVDLDPAEPEASRRREALRALLEPLASVAEWRSASPHRRSLRAFGILDALSQFDARDPELEAVASVAGLPAGDGDPVGDLLLRLIELEGGGSEAMLDPGFLHRVRRDGVLLALIPTRRSSELLPVLADGVEHRLRQRLALDPQAKAERDLLRVAVRAPHSEFWEALETLVHGRSYPGVDGAEAGVESLLAHRSRTGAFPSETPLLDRLRGTATAEPAGGSAPLVSDLHGLAVLLVGRDRGTAEDRVGLRTFILWINEGRPRCLSRTAAAGEGPGTVELTERVGDWAHHLLDLTGSAPGGELSPGDVARTRSICSELRTDLLPLLPLATAEAFEAALDRLEARLASEASALALLESLREEGPRSDSEEKAAAGSDMSFLVRALDHPADALLEPDGVRAFRSRVSGLWREALSEAMDQGHESRVRRLLGAPGVEGAGRVSPEPMVSTLDGVRRWWFDRYALLEGRRVSRLMSRIDGARRSFPGDLGRFLGLFSPLWLALLIGAILMLDFGDAWKSMVEVEDLRGVLITFLVGAGGALGYLAFELRRKVRPAPEDRNRGLPLLRLSGFFGLCLGYALAVTTLMWLLLSRTEEVVHGSWAAAHVVVWAGFALFVGVFFGMIAKE